MALLGSLSAIRRLLSILVLLQRHCHKRERHQALLATPLPTNVIIFNLTCEEIMLKFFTSSPITVEVINTASPDPERWRLIKLATTFSFGPRGFINDNGIAELW